MAAKEFFPFPQVYNKSIRQNLILHAHSETEPGFFFTKQKKERKVKVRAPSFTIGRWTKQETVQYIRFLQDNYSEFVEGGQSRRLKRTFVRMADHIGSRDSDQCRSHHQKMLAFRSTVDDII